MNAAALRRRAHAEPAAAALWYNPHMGRTPIRKAAAVFAAACALAATAGEVPFKADCATVSFDFGGRTLSIGPFEARCRAGASVSFSAERADDGVVRVRVAESAPGALEDVRTGAASAALKSLWYGNGHYVLRPGAFSIDSNGHANSTSFDGFDFENGVSVVMASTSPISELYHDPATRRCGIAANAPTVFTFVAGTNGAAECAIRYRRLFPPKAAPGVAGKTGRFCIDLWNGTLKDQTRLLRAVRAAGIGDDAVVYTHNWQRFGYDAGLPDVFPPNPKIGTAGDLREFLATAHAFGWHAGVHINTIDAYCDAPSFDPSAICRDSSGAWIKAWFNAFTEKQSYRVRPDRQAASAVMQLGTINGGGCAPDTVFVDVIGSLPSGVMEPGYGADGVKFDIPSVVRGYGAVFDAIREMQDAATGRRTFTASEAAHDFLAGHLDGGDCQWLELQREEGEYSWYPVADFEMAVKVPWFDMVNHKAFSLHGAGYSVRYESGRGALFHGMDSDDYLCAEILSGHPPMIECYTRDVSKIPAGIVEPIDIERSVAQASRHYMLLQKAISELAHSEIEDFEFAGGDPARQIVRWSNGTTVYANRGKKDWSPLPGTVLPQYGWFSTNAVTGTMSALRRENGLMVEESRHRGPDGKTACRRFVRNRDAAGVLPLVPAAAGRLDAGRLSVSVSFEKFGGRDTPETDITATLWLVRRKRTENQRTLPDFRLCDIAAKLGGTFDATVELPSGASGKYDLLVSLVKACDDPADAAKRLKTLGTDSFYTRYHIGRVETGKAFVPYVQPDGNLYERAFPAKEEKQE